MDDLITEIRKTLHNSSDKKVQDSSRSFFKEEIQSYGVKSADVIKISKDYFKLISNSSKEVVFGYCEELWQSTYLEESFIACNWSYFVRTEYQPADLKIFEKWIGNYVNNWASCDTLCNHTVGAFIEMYPEYLTRLKELTKSSNRWLRRATAVSLIIPARKGMFINDIFEIADSLLMDKDDLVQKGYGWMLKVACQHHQQEVFEYIMDKKSSMPRTALRYAIEKMPLDMKSAAMKR